MKLSVTAPEKAAIGQLSTPDNVITCALGPAGIVSDKTEGDGATPVGEMALLKVFFRPDRVERPQTGLPTAPILPTMGWCDDPSSPAYNRLVRLPFAGSHEKMWREDHAYDICVVLDWNIAAPQPGKGSAIFFHLAKPGYSPTEGCIAVSLEDMIAILARCGPDSVMETSLSD